MKRREVILAASAILWLAAIGVGMKMVLDYSFAAGEAAAPPSHWPAAPSLQPAADRATLVMLVHPQCPCSRASVRELSLLMTTCRDNLTAYVAFCKPEGYQEDWVRTDLWRSPQP